MNAQHTPLEGQPQTAPPETMLPPVPPAMPVAAPTAARRYSPGLAVVLSFFPGLGHLYLGMYQRGMAFFLAFAAAIFFADHADALGVVVAFVWFFAVIDAYRQAQALNAGLTPEPMTGATRAKARQGNLGLGVFLTVIGLLLLYNQFYPLDLTFLYTWWPMVLVGFGVYMVVKHLLEQKKRRAAADLEP